jgi:MFS family permease
MGLLLRLQRISGGISQNVSRDIDAVADRLGETYGRPFIDDIMPLTSSEQFGPIRVIALAVVSTSAWLSITLLPYEVSTLSVGYHVGPVRAGWIAAAELLAVACAASYVGQSIAVRDKRRLTIFGVAIALGASIGCIFADHLVIIIALRLLFGVGTGIIAAATNALPTLHEAPERLFAYMQLALGVVFGFLLALAPAAFLLPKGLVPNIPPSRHRMSLHLPGGAARSLAALGIMWIAQGALWAFAATAGAESGMDADSLARWLSIAGFTTPFGALAAAALGDRRGYRIPFIVGFGVQIFVALAEYCFLSRPFFIAGALVSNMTTTFTTPYVQGVLASLDGTGRATALSGASANFGAAIGPALGAVLVGRTVVPIGITSSIMFFVGLALALSSLRSLAPRSTSRSPA